MKYLKIFGKRFSLLAVFLSLHKSHLSFPFVILCGLLFIILTNDVQTTCFLYPNNRGWYFHLKPNCKFREKTSAKRYHPSETDNLRVKTLPFLILIISIPYLQWVSKVCMQRRVLLIPPFRQLCNLVNNIHKRALKFTYDDKGNKLNNIAQPNMKAYYQSLKPCFVLSMFFAIFKYAIMRTNSLHPNDHSVLEKAT